MAIRMNGYAAVRRAVMAMALAAGVSPSALGQTWDEVCRSPETYLWGEGAGTTVAEADRQALSDLVSKISLQVASVSHERNSETYGASGVSGSNDFTAVISTYGQATLTNTTKVVLVNEPDARVGRWIKRSEIDRIFESRRRKVADYVAEAERAESKGRIDIALKDYAWALALLKSLQYPDEVTYEPEEGDGGPVLLGIWLPARMQQVLEQVSVTPVGRRGDDLEVEFTYKGVPVTSLDYSYFDGRDWSGTYTARDGRGVIELAPGDIASGCQVKIEYEHRGEAHIDREVESVMGIIQAPVMRGAYHTVSLDGSPAGSASSASRRTAATADAGDSGRRTFTGVSPQIYRAPVEYSDPEGRYAASVNRVVECVARGDYDGASGLFTPYAGDIYARLVKYGRARLAGKPDVRLYDTGHGIQARGVKMTFSFSSGARRSFVEELVFSFDGEGRISNLSFGLDDTAEDDILGRGVWSEEARFAIMEFLENYRTAYALKRLDYIETIFDDDAVIITGSLVSKVPAGTAVRGDVRGLSFGGQEIVKYNRYDKESYLRQLSRSFGSKEYINLRFADNEVRKLGKGGEMYAIQISQEYFSSNYGDKGYLFLMVDINDPASPVIKVRTWQPEKDPDFGIYGPEDFN